MGQVTDLGLRFGAGESQVGNRSRATRARIGPMGRVTDLGLKFKTSESGWLVVGLLGGWRLVLWEGLELLIGWLGPGRMILASRWLGDRAMRIGQRLDLLAE